MKREIKFRGKRVDNGEWITGNIHIPNRLFTGVFICPDTTYGDIAPGMEEGDNFIEFKKYGAALGHYHKVIPESVGESTGIKDKNGKEIYEGDIVKVKNGENPAITECKWDWGVFTLVDNAGGHWNRQLFHEPDRLKVIGNIYENSDLL